MAAAADVESSCWIVNKYLKVEVYNGILQPKESDVVLKCIDTDDPEDGLKNHVKAGVMYIDFPVPKFTSLTRQRNILGKTFSIVLQENVRSQRNRILISIDEVKTWTKVEFCHSILTEFLGYVKAKDGIKNDFEMILTFCADEIHNYNQAVKCCNETIGTKVGVLNAVKDNRKSCLEVVVIKGFLDETKADALACTISTSMDLRQGAVSKALLDSAGKKLQKDLERSYDKDRAFGKITVVPGYDLACNYVLFGVMWQYEEALGVKYRTEDDYYRASVDKFVQECLNEAETWQCKSVAFPAIGSGNLKYPVDIVAEQMFTSVENWGKRFGEGSIKKIIFVVCPTDKVALQEFGNAERRRSPDNQRKVLHSLNANTGSKRDSNVETLPLKTTTFQLENPNNMGGRTDHARSEERSCNMNLGKTTLLIPTICQGMINKLKCEGCSLTFQGDTVSLKCNKAEVFDMAVKKLKELSGDLEKRFPNIELLNLTPDFKEDDIQKKVSEIENKMNIICVVTEMKTVHIFGKDVEAVQKAKCEITSLVLPPRTKKKDQVKEEPPMGARPKEVLSDNGKIRIKEHTVSRQFSWSTHAKGFQMFITKENVEIKVYSADILKAPVDCIVNAANINLAHGGGIARAIAKAAGKDLNQEGREYLKQHGKLQVGEACSTSAGKMPYVCVIHTVGPCWDAYKPYSLKDVEKCEVDLYNAVINSLTLAEKKGLQTVAVSSISSGIYGCPRELCSVQYAKAVLDYSRLSRSPVSEIHFVDTNMDMVKMIKDAFLTMIPDEKLPNFYNKMVYVRHAASQTVSSSAKHLKPGSSSFQPQDQFGDKQRRLKNSQSKEKLEHPFINSTIPPGQISQQFTCCLGEGQNLYVYTCDILSLKTDVIVCGNIPSGKTTGKLAKAIDVKAGTSYVAEKETAFKKSVSSGDVIVCSSGKLKNFKWIAHALLFLRKQCKGEDRKRKVNSVFCKIFQAMHEKGCHSLALPLVGTGEGQADPEYIAERFIESLIEFGLFNRGYRFSIHLVHREDCKTKVAVDVISKYIREVDRSKVKPYRDPNSRNTVNRPSSAHISSAHSQFLKQSPKGSSSVDARRGRSHENKFNNSRSGYQPGQNRDSRGHREGANDNMNDNKHPSQGRNRVGGKRIVKKSDETKNLKQSEERWKQNSTEFEIEESSDEEYNVDIKNSPPKEFERAKKAQGNLNIIENSSQVQVTQAGSLNDAKAGNDESDSDEASDSGLTDHVANDGGGKEIETCVICMEDITNPKILSCGHIFCNDCIQEQFTYKEACPTCGKVCGIITGDQPYGKMDVFVNDRASCAGFENWGRIEITYKFDEGRQRANHPVPGARYKGITRTAYLPDNRRGKEVCEMLKVAFDRKLVFTIGRSRTTGADGVITWNDIHHKTDPKPNTQFGYPDPTYLDRVTEELEVKGVTVNDVPTVSVPRHRRR